MSAHQGVTAAATATSTAVVEMQHGDLDSSLKNPPKDLMYMAKDGANMVCSDCHTFNSHQPSGSRYAATARSHGLDLPRNDHNQATCESCHSSSPHQQARLNMHTGKLACQTCHIPAFARGGVATNPVGLVYRRQDGCQRQAPVHQG